MYKEVTPSTGYNINNEEIDFSIQYENQFVEFMERSFTSEEAVKKNDIEIIKKLQKTDSTPQMNLAGAKFSATLKSDRSKVYYSEPTDESGYCIIQNLPYGTYEIEEIVVPDVALKIDNFDVFVEQDSSERGPYQYTKENVAKKMQITIYKEDIETGRITQGDARLEDSEYTIYRDEALTDAVETVKIAKQDDGSYKAVTGNYLVGTYYIKETKRPEGYLIDEKVYSSVTSRNATAVFDYLGIKWSTEKVMTLQACGDYLSFYQRHYQWQNVLKKFDYLSTLLERKRKRQEEKVSSASAIKSQYLQGILLGNCHEFFLDTGFIKFCEQLMTKNSPLLYEPEFLAIILEILNENTSNLSEITDQKSSAKVIRKISQLTKKEW